jgi:hypothetical protein
MKKKKSCKNKFFNKLLSIDPCYQKSQRNYLDFLDGFVYSGRK